MQVMDGFISATNNGEAPHDSLMEAADNAVDELAEWQAKIKEAMEAAELQLDECEGRVT